MVYDPKRYGITNFIDCVKAIGFVNVVLLYEWESQHQASVMNWWLMSDWFKWHSFLGLKAWFRMLWMVLGFWLDSVLVRIAFGHDLITLHIYDNGHY